MLKEAEADESAGEVQECQMQISPALVADGEPAEAIDPGEGPLDNPATLPI